MGLREFLAADRPARVAVAQAAHRETLATVHEALAAKIAEVVLIGDAELIKRTADEYHFDITGSDIIDEADEQNIALIAAGLARDGEVQAVMKGNIHTSVFTRALLDSSMDLIDSGGVISHVSLFGLPGYPKPLFLTDCAVNIKPDLTRKIGILRNAITAARRMGIAIPKVACIAPVESVNEKIESTVHARDLVMMQEREHCFGDVVLEGPLALDGALSRDAAQVKGIESAVAGDADILLFPNLDAGNGVYKALALFGGAEHAGILAGLKVPAVLTSRSDNAHTRLLSLRFALCTSAAQAH